MMYSPNQKRGSRSRHSESRFHLNLLSRAVVHIHTVISRAFLLVPALALHSSHLLQLSMHDLAVAPTAGVEIQSILVANLSAAAASAVLTALLKAPVDIYAYRSLIDDRPAQALDAVLSILIQRVLREHFGIFVCGTTQEPGVRNHFGACPERKSK